MATAATQDPQLESVDDWTQFQMERADYKLLGGLETVLTF